MYNILMPETKSEQLIAAHIGPISDALRHLQGLLMSFGKDLVQEASPAVVFEPVFIEDSEPSIANYRELGAGPSRQRSIDAFLQIEYGMDDQTNQSTKCYGALGVPKRLLNQALLINRAKSELKDTMRAVARKRIRIAVKDRDGNQSLETRNLSTVILRRIQSSSINLLAAYREIPLLEETPASINLTHTRTRSVPRKTAAELLTLLAERNDPLAFADRERLESIDPNEYLVSPKEHYPRTRANIAFRRTDKNGKVARQIMMAELPILYPIRKGVRPPDLSTPPIGDKPRKQRPTRIEADEFVKTHHFRRMLPGHREHAKPPRRA